MTWAEICEDKSLADLPYKIETNEHGSIIMSPAKHWHGKRQGRIVRHLDRISRAGEIITEVGIETGKGVKVPDVSWCSDEFAAAHVGDEYALTAAPDICIEVLSESNSGIEVDEKKFLYFAHGASEVWICDMLGAMAFFITPTAEVPQSKLFPGFPAQV
ncbi:MAG: Uma2 family endonuclease [Verrucomicrobiaceae bacterium]|nr:Uma2 family endonuclease [Verrucomicrobiaceae bacterium]